MLFAGHFFVWKNVKENGQIRQGIFLFSLDELSCLSDEFKALAKRVNEKYNRVVCIKNKGSYSLV